MSSTVVMIHGYGFCFQKNAVGIIPSKFYGFLEQHPHVKKKVMDKGSDFFEAVCKNRASKEMIAYEDLGPEAIRRYEVKDFPAIVCIDSEGNDFYKVGIAKYSKE